MEKDTYYFNYFNGFSVDINDCHIDLRKECGKQLSNLFALIIDKQKSISKDELIETLWSESDSPRNALKFAIHRLRNKLKEIDGLPDIEYVVTTAQGYQINPDITIVKDYIVFENTIKQAQDNKDTVLFEKAIHQYKGDFLLGYDSSWTDGHRRYYKDLMLKICNRVASIYLGQHEPKKAIEIAGRGLQVDDLDERLIYTFINALINDHQYHQAMTYYNQVNQRYEKILGLPLRLKSQLTKAIEAHYKVDENEQLKNDYDVDNFKFKPMQVDMKTFNSLCEFAVRNYIVTREKKYLISFKTNSEIEGLMLMDDLILIIQNTIRCNDVITRNNNSEVLLLVSLNNSDEGQIIYDRIVEKLHLNENIQVSHLTYSIKSLVDNIQVG